VRSEVKTIKGTLLLVSADNLASHFLGGFKALNAPLRKCRHCLAIEPNFTGESSTPRTRSAHTRYIEELPGPNPGYISTAYGVARDSILNRSAYLHVVDGLVLDVMHHILEGVLQAAEQRLQTFDYGYNAAKDKPSPIRESRIQSTESNLLGQSGNFLSITYIHASIWIDVLVGGQMLGAYD
jgi:hypothetical protein